MSSNEVVALTGASGSAGAVVLEHLVSQAHYKVNVILRSFAKSKSFLEQRYPEAVTSGKLVFTEIPDMTAPGVFDDVLASADKLIHVATPLASDDFEEKVLKPATKIMDNVLYGAKKSPKIKRVIITGSVVSVVDMPSILMTKEAATGRTFTPADFNPITREHAEDNGANAYAYSKVTAEKQAWAFMKRESPSFDLVFILSPMITGRSIEQGWRAVKQGLGGISTVYRSFLDVESPPNTFPYFQDIDDVASMHVKSLDTTSVPGNKRYLATGGLLNVNEIAPKIREEFPELRSRVPEKSGEGLPADIYKLDLTETDAVFGKENKDAWQSVKATVQDIITSEARFGKL